MGGALRVARPRDLQVRDPRRVKNLLEGFGKKARTVINDNLALGDHLHIAIVARVKRHVERFFTRLHWRNIPVPALGPGFRERVGAGKLCPDDGTKEVLGPAFRERPEHAHVADLPHLGNPRDVDRVVPVVNEGVRKLANNLLAGLFLENLKIDQVIDRFLLFLVPLAFRLGTNCRA